MVFVVEMDVSIPDSWSDEKIAEMLAREKECSQKWQASGKWKHLWRVTARYANISVLEVDGPDELHEIISSLPLFPYMNIKVTSVCRHPNAIRPTIL